MHRHPDRQILIMKLLNATQKPQRYFGLHMNEGVAEYRDPKVNNGEPYRILVAERAIKNMDPTFEGRPVYVKHVDDVDLKNIHEAGGFVVRSFYNKSDGKHWVEFLVISDRGHQAISNGWKLSNAYVPTSFSQGGLWHGVEYAKEVENGEYEHLAIVPDPRYAESIILTPAEFKTYNNEKELELTKLANSTEGERPMLNFFKKNVTKLENAAELEATSVTLPKSKKEITILELVNKMDAIENMQGYANGDHLVKAGEEEMTVNEMVKKFKKMNDEAAKSAEDKKENDQDEKKEPELDNESDEEDDDKKKKSKKENEDDQEEEKEPEMKNKGKKKNAADPEKKPVDKDQSFFNDLKSAHLIPITEEKVFELAQDQVERGKARYGSK